MKTTKKKSTKPRLGRAVALPYEAISWIDDHKEVHTARADRPATSLGLERALPCRDSKNYPGRLNHPGYYWFAGSQRHVRYESMTEFTALIWFDHMYDIRAIAAQPMCLYFQDRTSHYPDFFAVETSGAQILIDVHPEERTDDEDRAKFSRTESLCVRVGWTYVLFTGVSRALSNNLEWLAAYRYDRCLPPRDVTRDVQDYLKEPRSLRETALWLGAGSVASRIHFLYSLMWHRIVLFDEEQPLSWATTLSCQNTGR